MSEIIDKQTLEKAKNIIQRGTNIDESSDHGDNVKVVEISVENLEIAEDKTSRLIVEINLFVSFTFLGSLVTGITVLLIKNSIKQRKYGQELLETVERIENYHENFKLMNPASKGEDD